MLYPMDLLNAKENLASEMYVTTVEIHCHITCLFKWWQIGERYLNICVNFPDFIKPVKLPSRSQQMNSFAGHRLRVSGWGSYSDSRWRIIRKYVNTLRTGDADLRFYITTVQDGWRKSAFLTRACFPCTIYLIMQYIEPVSGWSCWRMFIETWTHSELNFKHRASSI